MSYEVDSDGPLDADVLARVRFGRDLATSSDPRQANVCLAQLGDVPLSEIWRSRLPVVRGGGPGLGYAHNGEVLFGHLSLDERELAGLRGATTGAYVRIARLLRRLGYPCRLRMWNFLPDINAGDGDAERYRRFSEGRYQALALEAGFEDRLPAATAIGTRSGGMTVCFLAARHPGEPIENPRQVSAFRYPAFYGPRSPSFSRAHLKHWPDGRHLFVSGTASVVGHRSLHPDDPRAQLDETWRNFQALLERVALLEPSATPLHALALKVFIRRDEHCALLLPRVRELFGAHVPLLALSGDICRRDLLLEIEGLFGAAPVQAFRQVAA